MTSAQIDTIQALENENKILADEVKMKEELIPGMEELVNHIRELEAENKKLKQERDFFESEFHKTLQHQADDTEHYEKENKELRKEIAHKNKLFGEWCEENRKLKDTILRWQEKADFNLSDSDEEESDEEELTDK